MCAQRIILVNNSTTSIQPEVDENMPLLWFLRDHLGLTGTKYGCGIGQCGSCTVLVDGLAKRSCLIPVGSVLEKNITTIEGVSEKTLHPVQQAWLKERVSQCGYCQSGQIMSAIALLSSSPNPTAKEIDNAMSSNLCRCGTYQRVRNAIQQASRLLSSDKNHNEKQ